MLFFNKNISMIQKIRLEILFITAIALLVSSCKKEGLEKCIAGPGGELTLKVYLQHAEHAVVNLKNYRDTIYIKYNTLENPGASASAYDAVYIGEWPGDFVTIHNLKCGDYYLFGTGYETVHSYRVSGGIPFSTSQKSGEIKVTIPVSE
jgi:hypothetical protein